MLRSVDYLGVVAACCTTMAFVPQAVKTIKSRDTEALSLGMYSFFTVGILLWFLYGVFKNDYCIIAANGITIVLASVILFHKLKNDVLPRK